MSWLKRKEKSRSQLPLGDPVHYFPERRCTPVWKKGFVLTVRFCSRELQISLLPHHLWGSLAE